MFKMLCEVVAIAIIATIFHIPETLAASLIAMVCLYHPAMAIIERVKQVRFVRDQATQSDEQRFNNAQDVTPSNIVIIPKR